LNGLCFPTRILKYFATSFFLFVQVRHQKQNKKEISPLLPKKKPLKKL
jgi:hypothetical protein